MSKNTDKPNQIEEALVEAINAEADGKYIKEGKEYFFKLRGDSEFSAVINAASIDFKIFTISWIPGNYEPIIGSQLYLSMELKKMEGLKYQDIYEMLKNVIMSLDIR